MKRVKWPRFAMFVGLLLNAASSRAQVAIEALPLSESAAVTADAGSPQPDAAKEAALTTIVTANKAPQAASGVTQSVRVIENTEWVRFTTLPTNLATLLQREPGQFVNPLSRNDANWGSLGGLGPSYSSFLLDGLPIDTIVDPMSLDPWVFERIEQQRGPASVMYGNFLGMDFAGNESPLSGVTNFVLKDRIERPETRLLAAAGSWGTVDARGIHQGSAGNFHYFLGGGYERSDYANYGTDDSWLHMLRSPEFTKVKVYGKGAWFFDRPDHELSVFAHHTSHLGIVGRPNRDFDNAYDTVNAVYSNQLTSSLRVDGKAGLRLYNRRWGEDNYPDLSLREHDGVRQRVLPMDLTLTWAHLGESLLTAGVDGQLIWYDTYAEVDGVRAVGNAASAGAVGVFAQEKLAFGPWVLRAGGRFLHHGQTGSILSQAAPSEPSAQWNVPLWSAGVRFNGLGPVSLYANAGSSFVAPSVKAVGGTLLLSDEGAAGKNGQLPNPSLRPQSGLAFDLGGDLRLGRGFSAGVRGFANLVNDVIVDNVVSQEPSQTKSVNAGSARSLGVEASAQHRINRFVEWFANFTWTSTSVGNAIDADQNGAAIPFVPNFTANGGVTVHLPWQLMASAFVTGTGAYFDSSSKASRKQFGPYAVVSAKVMKVFALDGYTLTAAVDLQNLTNNRYVMPWQFRDPGFFALGSLELRH